MINAPSNNIENLSQVFSKILLQWLGQDKINSINQSNDTDADKSGCASHDHCDSNQAMIIAYKIVYGREPFIDESPAVSGTDTDRVNTAFAMAKANRFAFHHNA